MTEFNTSNRFARRLRASIKALYTSANEGFNETDTINEVFASDVGQSNLESIAKSSAPLAMYDAATNLAGLTCAPPRYLLLENEIILTLMRCKGPGKNDPWVTFEAEYIYDIERDKIILWRVAARKTPNPVKKEEETL